MFSKNKKVFKVDGMHCNHCAKKIEEGLLNINIDKVKVNLSKGEVTVKSNEEIDLESVKKVITELGFIYQGEI